MARKQVAGPGGALVYVTAELGFQSLCCPVSLRHFVKCFLLRPSDRGWSISGSKCPWAWLPGQSWSQGRSCQVLPAHTALCCQLRNPLGVQIPREGPRGMGKAGCWGQNRKMCTVSSQFETLAALRGCLAMKSLQSSWAGFRPFPESYACGCSYT